MLDWPNPFYPEGANATVAVEQDANATGSTTGQRGGVNPSWQAVAGSEAVPCLVMLRTATTIEQVEREGIKTVGTVMFFASIALTELNRLVYQDPDFDKPRHLYCDGATINPHGANPFWTVNVCERLL